MAPRPKEELETVIPKTLAWLRDIAPTLPSPVNCARILVAAGTIELLQKDLDAALAEVERLKGEVKWWKREAATGQDNVNFITQQERDWR